LPSVTPTPTRTPTPSPVIRPNESQYPTPVISNIRVLENQLTAKSAVISFDTDLTCIGANIQYLSEDGHHGMVGGYTDPKRHFEISLSELSPETFYRFEVVVLSEHQEQGISLASDHPENSFTTKPLGVGGEADSDPLPGNSCQESSDSSIIIDNVIIDNFTDEGAVFSWQTRLCRQGVPVDHPASSWVYVTENADESIPYRQYDHNFGLANRVVSHQVIAKMLKPATTYFYKIISSDSDNNFGQSMMGTFITLGQPDDLPGVVLPGEETTSPGNPGQPDSGFPDFQGTAGSFPPVAGSPSSLTTGNPGTQSTFRSDFSEILNSLKTQSPLVLPLLIVVLVLLALVIALFLAKRNRPAVISTTVSPKPKKFKWLLIIIILVFFVVPGLSFGGQLLVFNLLHLGSNRDDTKIDEALQKYEAYLNAPVAAIDYQPVPANVRDAVFNCQAYSAIPDKTKNYLCQNLYQVDEEGLKQKVRSATPQRIFLYGQYSYFDCLASAEKATDPVGECYRAAKFLDNWQIRHEADLLGRNIPKKKIYYYLTETSDQTKALCAPAGSSADNVGGCIKFDSYSVFSPSFWGNGSFFLNYPTVNFFERSRVGVPEKITYTAKMVMPVGCYLFDNHEIQHLFMHEANPNLPYWFEEGLISLMGQTMSKNLCSPGSSFHQVTKEENGQITNIPSPFNLDSLDWQEPLSSKVVQMSEDVQCRKGIYMQIAHDIRDGGIFYLKKLFNQMPTGSFTTEAAVANLVWQAGGKTDAAKLLLKNNGCF
jgi:hypothetical protein